MSKTKVVPQVVPQLVKVPDAAKFLGCSERTVQRMVQDGKLDVVVVGKRLLRIPMKALEEYVAQGARRSKSQTG